MPKLICLLGRNGPFLRLQLRSSWWTCWSHGSQRLRWGNDTKSKHKSLTFQENTWSLKNTHVITASMFMKWVKAFICLVKSSLYLQRRRSKCWSKSFKKNDSDLIPTNPMLHRFLHSSFLEATLPLTSNWQTGQGVCSDWDGASKCVKKQ